MLPLLAVLLQQGLSLAASAVATKGAEYLEEKTGVKIDVNATSLTPEDLTKIKQAELENEEEWREFRISEMAHQEALEKLAAEDRNSARSMQVEALKQGDLFSKRFVYVFIGGWSVFCMAFIMLTTFLIIPAANMRIVDTTQGFLLGTALAACFNYLLGTTARSAHKDDTIQTLAKGEAK